MGLTTTTLNAAGPKDVLRDATVTGLHTRGKRFYLYFRTKAGKERRPKLGEYPTMSLAQARKLAQNMLLDVANGGDPMAERQAALEAPTLTEVLARFEREHLARRKSGEATKKLLRKYVPDRLLRLKVLEVRHRDLYQLHDSLSNAPIVANRVLSHLSTLFSKCEVWGYRDANSNPCRGVERYPEKKRKRYMSPAEASAIAKALDDEWESNAPNVAFIQLLILTGARKGEIAAARWDWIHGSTLQLPDSKTGAKTVFLPPAAMAVLERLPRTSGTLTGIQAPYKLWYKIRERAGCPDLRLHDLRHSFASAAISAGLTLDQIGELLGHASTQTTKRYAHLVDATAQAAAARTADAIGAMLNPTENES